MDECKPLILGQYNAGCAEAQGGTAEDGALPECTVDPAAQCDSDFGGYMAGAYTRSHFSST